MSESESSLVFHVTDEHWGQRLDQVAAIAFSDYSRSRLQEWIKSGDLTVDDQMGKSKDKLQGGECLRLHVVTETETHAQPEPIDLNIIFEDEHIIVLNKPADLVVHPGAGVPNGTLLNGLLYHYPELAELPRAGIVHRLDKQTTGIMVVARSLMAHTSLVQQLQDRSLGREYEAVVMGQLTGGGKVDKPIGRHPTNRLKMAVLENSSQGKEAVTHYRLLERFSLYTHIRCQLETGRTHQIRVHLAHIKHPIVGDPVYLVRQKWLKGTGEPLKQCLAGFNRQALHAKKLTLVHPATAEILSWETELPADIQALLVALKDDKRRMNNA